MKSLRILAGLLLLGASASQASAQYYELANQIPQLLSPALSGSFNYKGFVDLSYTKGVGPRQADFVEVTTTQGFQYASWFYMGVGAGVQVVMTNRNDNYNPWQYPGDWDSSRGTSRTGWMLPLYTDFRFNIGEVKSPSFFIDCRIGASFLLNNDYLEIGDGFLSSNQTFYFKPGIGMRIPLTESGKQAFNIALNYQLMTQNYWYRSSSNITLSSFGASVGFEW